MDREIRAAQKRLDAAAEYKFEAARRRVLGLPTIEQEAFEGLRGLVTGFLDAMSTAAYAIGDAFAHLADSVASEPGPDEDVATLEIEVEQPKWVDDVYKRRVEAQYGLGVFPVVGGGSVSGVHNV